ncbi:MAG: tRNA modification GTPase MnmE [Candidatus Binatia bacterium]|nr:MAG: tRNA modification GTPase MnmE [Candidatus Binatia bacterium]
MYVADTIAAVATPAGPGGIGIVRLSGPDALAIGLRLFRFSRPVPRPQSHRLYPGTVLDRTGRALDRGLFVVMLGPRSYTGEDVVEFHCHGSPLLLRLLVRECCALGARPAERGEFTRRAFFNRKIDLVQAEAVAQLVGAKSEGAVRAGAEQLAGALSAGLAEVRESLLSLEAHLEALIDFPEEDLELEPQALLRELERVAAKLRDLAASFERGRLLREGLRVVLVGKPNVGKSSLLNALLGTERAIVTPIPGTTRDVIEESVEIEGIPVVLCDTAGLRSDPDEVEKLGIDRTRARLESADGVVVVLDRSSPLDVEDLGVLEEARSRRGVLAVNKCDLAGAWEPRLLAEQAAGKEIVELSAKTGQGLDRLLDALARCFMLTEASEPGPTLTLARHRDLVEKARSAVERAREALASGIPPDAAAVDIQAALEHIGCLTGEVTTEEVLDRIFSEFCVGK